MSARSARLAFVLLLALPSLASAIGMQTTATHSISERMIEPMRLRDLFGLNNQVGLINSSSYDLRATILALREPYNDRLPGQGRANGRAETDFGCAGARGATQNLGRNRARFDADSGASIATRRIDANRGCFALFTQTTFSGNQMQPAGSTVTSKLSVQLLPETADPDCWDPDKLCMQGGRFKADLKWRDAAGLEGSGMSFPQTDNSGLFYVFSPDNWQMLVKVVDGCTRTDEFWVFASGATNVEYTLTVTDTQTDTVRTYFNPLGQPAPAVVDTRAFATCP